MGWRGSWAGRMLLPWTRAKTAVSAASVAVVAGGIAAGLVLIPSAAPPAPPRPKPSVPAPTPSPPAHHQLLSPFTGEPVKSLQPTLAVKIDNIVYARPQTGINQADIVYVLPVEGGLTRFMAIFSSRFPPVIGPVRSARRDDLQLLGQFGRPAFSFSGAQGQLLPVVEKARIVDLYAGIASGYFRNYSRIAPYNLFASTKVLLSQAKKASKARNIGFRFGPPPAGGTATRSQTVTYPAARFTFTWSASSHRWLVSMDGAAARTTSGVRFAAATVVIQHTVVRTSGFLEYGVAPPYAESTGRGTATVLRDGKAYQARWSRPDWNGGTTFTTPAGKPMTFAAGQVWILLVGNRAIEAG